MGLASLVLRQVITAEVLVSLGAMLGEYWTCSDETVSWLRFRLDSDPDLLDLATYA